MPGSNPRALEKARTLEADVLILDLEDAVAPDAKAQARQNILDALLTPFGRRETVVRINGLDTPWGADDLNAIAPLGPDAILLPKVESGEQIRELAKRLEDHGAPELTRLWAMIETPFGVLRLAEIAGAHPRLDTLVMGTSDLVKDLHARHTRGRHEVLASLGLAVLAARAHGLNVLDGVHLDLDDEDGLREACRQGRDMGFDGKTLIHPKQLACANEIFGPSAGEIDQARRRIAAFDAARAAGSGVAVLDGKLVEELHVQDARRVLELARAIDAARDAPA
jgi:citrate lyase subunit beta/citryl-CoA lyase